MAELELGHLDPGELGMNEGEFSEHMESQIEAKVEEAVSEAANQSLAAIEAKFPGADHQALSAAVDAKLPEIKTNVRDQIHEQAGKQLGASRGSSDGVSDFDKTMNKALFESIDVDTVSREVITESLEDGKGAPDAGKMTDARIEEVSAKVVKEHIETVQDTLQKGMEDAGGDTFDEQAARDGLSAADPDFAEAKHAASEMVGDMTDASTRETIADAAEKVNSDEPISDADPDAKELKEAKSLREKIMESWDKDGFKKGFANLLKLAGVVACVMAFTKGGRKILGGAANLAGKAVGTLTKTLGGVVLHVFGPIIDGFKHVAGAAFNFLKKWGIYIILALIVFAVLRALIVRAVSGGGRGGKVQYVEMVRKK